MVECLTQDRGVAGSASLASLRCVLEQDTLIIACPLKLVALFNLNSYCCVGVCVSSLWCHRLALVVYGCGISWPFSSVFLCATRSNIQDKTIKKSKSLQGLGKAFR